jgi:hypothetical protein
LVTRQTFCSGARCNAAVRPARPLPMIRVSKLCKTTFNCVMNLVSLALSVSCVYDYIVYSSAIGSENPIFVANGIGQIK